MEYPKTVHELVAYPARLNLQFQDITLFQQALTHRSYLNEHPQEQLQDNERLEFLGDSVMHLLTSEWLFRRLPHLPEGNLTRLRAALVGNKAMAVYAGTLGLGNLMLMGKGESNNGGRARERNLSGAFEALLGALYLDQGTEAVRAFLTPILEVALAEVLHGQTDKDFKSRFQEWAMLTLNQIPTYRVVAAQGPEHAPEFIIQARIGEDVYGTGTGLSKQAAEQAAAQAAIAALREKGLFT